MDAWRLASPHWSPQRQRLIGKQLEALRAGEIEDPEEPDPEASFQSQWLNQWPRRRTEPPGNTEPLLPGGLWLGLAETGLWSTEPVFVAVEDDYGRGAGVAAVVRHQDGRLEVDGWECEDWDTRDPGRAPLVRVPGDPRAPRRRVDDRPGARRTRCCRFRSRRSTRRPRRGCRRSATSPPAGSSSMTRRPATWTGRSRRRWCGSRRRVCRSRRGRRHLIKAVAWAVAAAHKPARVFAVR